MAKAILKADLWSYPVKNVYVFAQHDAKTWEDEKFTMMKYSDLNPDLLKSGSLLVLDDCSDRMASGELTQLLSTIRHRDIYVICLLHGFTFSKAEARQCMNNFRLL